MKSCIHCLNAYMKLDRYVHVPSSKPYHHPVVGQLRKLDSGKAWESTKGLTTVSSCRRIYIIKNYNILILCFSTAFQYIVQPKIWGEAREQGKKYTTFSRECLRVMCSVFGERGTCLQHSWLTDGENAPISPDNIGLALEVIQILADFSQQIITNGPTVIRANTNYQQFV